MRKLDLNNYTIYEKAEWVEDLIGSEDLIDILLQRLKAGMVLETLIGELAQEGVYVDGQDDWVAVISEHFGVFDVVETLMACSFKPEYVVDELVVEHGLDYVDEPEFDSYQAWVAWRNS